VKHTSIIVAAGFALVALLPSTPAAARLFVSPTGSDSNDCSLATPCRNLQAAVYKSGSGGEITVLGTAGYSGGVTLFIDRAISIVNPGAFEAGISPPSGGIGIVINAGPNDAVSLRGLTIDGTGVAQTGIQFNTGKSLTVQDCIIRHVTSDGIDFVPNATSNLLVSNTLVADNTDVGIFVNPTGSGTVTAIFNRVEVSNNSGEGFYLWGANSTGTIKATVAESVVAHNANAGFFVDTGSGFAATTLTVFHSVSANNVDGIAATGTGATLRLAQTEVTGNSTAGWITNAGGVIASYGDNYIDGNGANTGSLTPIGKQ
jgi:hypothetical protein